ncbi:MAG: primosomal replication protein N [Betaproteobacteria bacterium]|nr:primosomal replication protein N [Betaproteobacteria bacterium]
MEANEVALSGELAGIEPLRHTPAGIPLIHFKLQHRSQQVEAGYKRQVECEISGVAMAEVAVAMARMKAGQRVRVSGFLNRKNRMSAQLLLHATRAE